VARNVRVWFWSTNGPEDINLTFKGNDTSVHQLPRFLLIMFVDCIDKAPPIHSLLI